MAALSFNKCTKVYICKAAAETNLSKWKILHEIEAFTMVVNYLEWSSDNKILAISYDNNCMVLEKEKDKDKWITHLVILESQYRTLHCGAWSHDGKKFAVGGGNKAIYIGYWDDQLRAYNSDRLKNCN